MATVPMPISLQVRATRTAISPRLAMRIFRMPTAANPTRTAPAATRRPFPWVEWKSVARAGRRPRMLRAEPERIHRFACQIDLVMQVGSRGQAAAAGAGDDLTLVHPLTVAHQQRVVVAIGGHHASPVIEHQDAAVDPVAAGAPDHPGPHGAHRGADGRAEIDSGVETGTAEERVLPDSEREIGR